MDETPIASQAGEPTSHDPGPGEPDRDQAAIGREVPGPVSANPAAGAAAPDNTLAASDVALAAALEADLAQLEAELAALEVPPSS